MATAPRTSGDVWEILPKFLALSSFASFLELRDSFKERFPLSWSGPLYQRFDLRRIDAPNQPLCELLTKVLTQVKFNVSKETWDAFMVVFPPGACCPPHVDPPDGTPEQEGKKQLRLNVLLQAASSGGELVLGGAVVPWVPGDAVVFHPDNIEHEVRQVASERLVLSFGVWYD